MLDAGPLPDGQHIRLLRRFRQKTLQETSDVARVTLARLFAIEKGKVVPNPIELARILGALAADPPAAATQAEDPEPSR
jgi:transcriptional regulator with XRE-family HTH domain